MSLVQNKPKILYLEDVFVDFQNLNMGLKKWYDIAHANNIGLFWNMLEQEKYDLILFDLSMEGNKQEDRFFKEGLKRISKVKERYPKIPLIVVSGAERAEFVVEAVKEREAENYFYKGHFDVIKWKNYIEETLKKIKKEKQAPLNSNAPSFVGISPIMQEIRKRLAFWAKKPDRDILIVGETGVGKELAVHYFHTHSLRKQQSLVAVNLMELSDSVLESELFGHEKGAFTDAKESRIGYFQKADQGILFLDEIAEIDHSLQVKLLRVLESKTIRKVGSNEDIKLNIQIIAATNKNLNSEIEKGNFRKDLYYRLDRNKLEIPPLRERREDIPVLIAHFLNTPPENLSELISPDALSKLMNYPYPGNIRELKNIVEYMQDEQRYFGKENIDIECLRQKVKDYHPLEHPNSNGLDFSMSLKEQRALEDLKIIDQYLFTLRGDKKATADKLNIDRDALRYKVKKLHKSYPQLFEKLPSIKKYYQHILK